ncbi:unnamed protein product [Hymenolepis diminuta]|uniref:Uncharacterized protein n=1 Tax=Hymenolepis diminuta TaxID=6216 RepID=A0A564YS02_HYMDI|nr:unnamed protein product [Hymenolepis diminuta]
MAVLPHATRINILPCKFNTIDHELYSFYLRPMDPTDLTYEKTISKLGSVVYGNSSLVKMKMLTIMFLTSCYAEIRLGLLSLLGKKPDVKKFRRGPGSAAGPLTASVQPERTWK